MADQPRQRGVAVSRVRRRWPADKGLRLSLRCCRLAYLEVDFRLTGIGRAYGPLASYEGTHSYLYRNNGDGRFTDVSAEAAYFRNGEDLGFHRIQ